jgi:predicted double-glycine peptidase
MPIIVSFVILMAFLGTMYPQRDIPKGEMRIYPNMEGQGQIVLRQDVKPLSEFDYKNVVKQEFDYSCGSAALATLLNYYLGERLTEQQVIQGLMQYGDSNKISQRRAFSLLDMKRFVEILGYNGSGYKAEFDDLKVLNKPAIIPIELSGYKHFVVYRGMSGGHIFFADPFRGNTSFTIEQFLTMWSQNIVFVVSSDAVRTNALKLKTEDLRVIDFDLAKNAVAPIFPPQTVTQQRDFQESQRHTFFKTINIR